MNNCLDLRPNSTTDPMRMLLLATVYACFCKHRPGNRRKGIICPLTGLRHSYLLFLLLPCFSAAKELISSGKSTWQSGDTLRLYVRHYTDENGLPQNSIKSIAPDASGYVWLATENGLVRFGGNDFKVFNRNNTGLKAYRFGYIRPGLGSKELFASTSANQWLSVEKGEATVLDGPLPFRDENKRSNVHIDGYLPEYLSIGLPDIFAKIISFERYLIPAGPDTLFTITRDSIWLRKTGMRDQVVRFPGSDPWRFFLISGQLFYLGNKGCSTFFGSVPITPAKLTGDILRSPSYGKGISQAVIYWNRVSENILLYLGQSFYAVSLSAAGDLETRLILTGFDCKTKNIISAYYDPADGRIFLGSLTEGLFVFQKKRFVPIQSSNNATDEIYYAQAPYGNDQVLTPLGKLMGVERGTLRTVAEQKETMSRLNRVDRYSILIGRDGKIWTKSKHTLYQFNEDASRLVASSDLGLSISTLYEGWNGDIWIGTETGGLYKTTTDLRHSGPVLVDSLLREITYFQQQDSDRLWVGTRRGLYCLRPPGRSLDTIPELEQKHIRSLYVDRQGELWITTEQDGIFLYVNGKLTSFPLDDYRHLATAHCIIADRHGYLWITTNKGLFQASREDMLAYSRGERRSLFYQYYGKDYGFYTNEFNGGCQPCAVTLNNGFISLPSLNGLVWIDPNANRPDLPDKALFVDGIELDGRNINLQDTIRLPRHFERLRVHLSTPYFGDKNNIQIEYALLHKNADPVWLRVDAGGMISQSTVPHGDYRLVIRKKNGFGKDNYSYKEISLYVAPAFYETRIFYGIILLLPAILIWLYATARLHYIKRKNRILEQHISERTETLEKTLVTLRESEENMRRQTNLQERLITVITHDIKSPLKYTALGAKGLLDDLIKERSPEPTIKNARILYESGHRIYHLTDNLLQYIKLQARGGNIVPERVDLHQLIEERLEIFRDIAAAQSTMLVNQTAPSLRVTTNARLLGVILHNLLDNATKVTHHGRITIQASVWENGWQLMVSDTGPGIPAEIMDWCVDGSNDAELDGKKWMGGLGLVIVKELAGLISGRLSAVSRPGDTVMTIHIS